MANRKDHRGADFAAILLGLVGGALAALVIEALGEKATSRTAKST